jgi:DNA-binding response OmpR family regulator
MSRDTKILWVDDEIDLLKPYTIFLNEKGFDVSTATNGADAISLVKENEYNLIILDENMPGLSGIQTLQEIKGIIPFVPVIMITKTEEENIMDEAIGSKIADYLIKPVNPNQILLAIKKNLDNTRLVGEKTSTEYRTQFNQISQEINSAYTFVDWTKIYRKLTYWELELENAADSTLDEVLTMQKSQANGEFARFIKQNYPKWFADSSADKPLLSPGIFKTKVFPLLDKGDKVSVILIDNLRYDQWKIIEKDISTLLKIESEDIFCSILPTVTQYARNSMFSGLMPYEIFDLYPDLWVFDEDESGKNLMEKELFEKFLSRNGKKYRYSYDKILNIKAGKKLVDSANELMSYDLNLLIYNFVDMLSHSRTDMEMIQELANNERAYRSITLSWFRHSHFLDLIKSLAGSNRKIILTTDHGSIRVHNAIKVVGDRKTSSNLRYKLGRNLDYNPKEVFEVKKPEIVHLPKSNLTSTYIFATNNDFLVYPNNYNHFANYYRNTFQHGGVSMEEMLLPFVVMQA